MAAFGRSTSSARPRQRESGRASPMVFEFRYGRVNGEQALKWAEKDRLYRCLDRSAPAEAGVIRTSLKQKWADLLGADFEVLLYDLTSTYFEGEMEQDPKAKRGYSRDGRPDCMCNW